MKATHWRAWAARLGPRRWQRHRLDAGGAANPARPGGWSLRRRLVLQILGASVVMWLVSLAIIVHVAWRETSSVFDDSMEEGARLALVLGSNLQAHGALRDSDPPVAREPARLKLYYQIVSGDGRVLRRAAGAPATPFSRDLTEDDDFQDVRVDGARWRVYLLRGEGLDFQVQIGQPWDERLDLLDEMAEELVWPALVMLLLLGAFCWLVIRHLLKPMERTASRIAAKSPQDLTPVPFAQDPRELRPIVQALNLVLGRLASALQAERRFTADAAHELRTPLAGLRMRIQLLQRQSAASTSAGAPPAHAAALQSLRDDVDRCTTLVESLLTLARLDPESPDTLEKKNVDLPALFARLQGEVLQDPSISLAFEARVAQVLAHPVLLESALRNLIDNALRYCPAGSVVRVEATAFGSGVRLAVLDDGPGVSTADRDRLTERFFRVLGTGEPGNGLGLSIVARMADLHGARLHFGPGIGGQGLGVMLDFPGDMR
ncbi:MAG: histidine kinase dimerization/phospho-acceptor domain-containing protein [Polaromonas sp.]|nr:histidine kinase dimerization/phospho-acceptor domain-containing protein [Polaromonas sp.]